MRSERVDEFLRELHRRKNELKTGPKVFIVAVCVISPVCAVGSLEEKERGRGVHFRVILSSCPSWFLLIADSKARERDPTWFAVYCRLGTLTFVRIVWALVFCESGHSKAALLALV